ncbi:ROK family protein [Rhizobium rhizogenes]|uniref:ROK family protein n=1 Tax=Rhizobium rhizogenes TaxID=359 RepID=UPI0015746FC7|nr:ROK family protein [Rhizobium rhizogenes]NTI33426.1 ROK family protein [Rhizobium rhizogenes]WEO65125.1 ROK family protein [Rhizobium rhizogenes]
MLDGGLLVEETPAQTGGVGKPARPLWFSADASPVCAVVLMPGRVHTSMVSLRGEIYGQQMETISNGESDREHYLAAIERCISTSLSAARGEALGIGIAVDGMIDPDTGSIVAMNLAPWLAGLELSRILEERFGVATIIDHHPRAILMGERWFGRGRGLKDFAIIYAGEGLACSLFLNGEPFCGPHGSGGELGHTIVAVHGEVCTCGRRGCWETIATLSWLRRRAAELGLADAAVLDVPKVCELAENSPSGQRLLSEYAYNLAVGIANLQTLLMPGNFIIYGNAAHGSARLLETIQVFVDELAFRHPKESIEITFGSTDQQSITLQGAAGLVIAEELKIHY